MGEVAREAFVGLADGDSPLFAPGISKMLASPSERLDESVKELEFLCRLKSAGWQFEYLKGAIAGVLIGSDLMAFDMGIPLSFVDVLVGEVWAFDFSTFSSNGDSSAFLTEGCVASGEKG